MLLRRQQRILVTYPRCVVVRSSAQAELGYTLFASGKENDATTSFRSAIDLLEIVLARLPDSHYDRRQLAILLANCPVVDLCRPDRALELARSMAEQQQADPNSLQLMGLCCYRTGNYDEAIQWLGRAMALRVQPDVVDALLMRLSNAKLERPSDAGEW